MAYKREQCKKCTKNCPPYIFQVKIEKGRIPFEKCMDFTPKQTNADRIRSMTDEELAEFFAHRSPCDYYCDYKRKSCNGISCKQGILGWLQSEVEGE